MVNLSSDKIEICTGANMACINLVGLEESKKYEYFFISLGHYDDAIYIMSLKKIDELLKILTKIGVEAPFAEGML